MSTQKVQTSANAADPPPPQNSYIAPIPNL